MEEKSWDPEFRGEMSYGWQRRTIGKVDGCKVSKWKGWTRASWTRDSKSLTQFLSL